MAKAVTKPSSAKKGLSIKYSDKSAGQPQLTPIFEELVKLMEPFAKGSLEKTGGENGQVGLVSYKPAEINGKQIQEVYLAGGLVQKGYVGFYFMPVYTIPELKSEIAPELLKCLKGKSCFHIKNMDDKLSKQIKEALKKGYDLYKKNGWIS